MDRQIRWDLRFLSMCKFISNWSKDPSTKCGSVIVHDFNKIVSVGYNGYASGVFDDDSLNIREEKYARVIHAEKNAILFARRDLTNHTLYVYPIPPCSQCASYIAQSGISRVVSITPEDQERYARWKDSNKISDSIFRQKGIEYIFYPENELNFIYYKHW